MKLPRQRGPYNWRLMAATGLFCGTIVAVDTYRDNVGPADGPFILYSLFCAWYVWQAIKRNRKWQEENDLAIATLLNSLRKNIRPTARNN